MSSFREALKEVKSEIRMVSSEKPKNYHTNKQQNKKPKQYLNGYELKWIEHDGLEKKVPTVSTKDFFVQYPTANKDIELPKGAVRATYNKEKHQVEYFGKGSDDPIKICPNTNHNPLPIPSYMRELENVEETFDIDMETGEITFGIKVDVLEDKHYWKLCLELYQKRQTEKGIPNKTVSNRIKKYLKSLHNQRGLTEEMLMEPIPQTILDAIEFAQAKQLSQQIGGK